MQIKNVSTPFGNDIGLGDLVVASCHYYDSDDFSAGALTDLPHFEHMK